jgi:protein gp37
VSNTDTGIEWTDATWNPLRGCSRVSEGCRHCYAETVAARFSDEGMPYHGIATRTPSGPRWTGKVVLVEDHLTDPLRWRKPRRVFVNSMSDLFHESVPDEWIDRIFAVMALAPQHTFQVLTKRAARMREYVNGDGLVGGINGRSWRIREAGHAIAGGFRDGVNYALELPNAWLGVSVEDQKAADERIPVLLQTPAVVRFISAEPLLGGIDIGKHRPGALGLHWVITGGESGTGARPCSAWWIRNLLGQCRDADIACFVKQLGANVFDRSDRLVLKDRKGGDMAEWPEDLRVREMPA